MALIKKIVKFFVPHGLVILYEYVKHYFRAKQRTLNINNFEKLQNNLQNLSIKRFNYENALILLTKLGLDEEQIRAGSIPEVHLDFIKEELNKTYLQKKDLVVLHIGNFVGLSLSYIADYLINRNSNNVLIGIDPNLEHRGIKNPSYYVKLLLSNYNLDGIVLLIDGFSFKKNLRNDGGCLYSDNIKINTEYGCYNALENLYKIGNQKIDICMIDGNHFEEYLIGEIQNITPQLTDGAILILDDVKSWRDVRNVFMELQKNRKFLLIAENERIGIFQYSK